MFGRDLTEPGRFPTCFPQTGGPCPSRPVPRSACELGSRIRAAPGSARFPSMAVLRSPQRGDLLLEARGLVKAYKQRRVVDGVHYRVEAGEIVCLLGPNGAGKTTS